MGNQAIAIFTLSSILIWMMRHDRKRYIWMPAIPLVFYSFVISFYILNARIGFLLPWAAAYIGGFLFTIVVIILALRFGKSRYRMVHN